eukprot:1861677-Prymnesium_polylepis.1
MATIGNVTNWSTLYEHVELPGCDTLVHFPIIDSTVDATTGNLYLSRPRPGELGALQFTRDLPKDERQWQRPWR